jgi:hypothetical protein
VAKIWFAKSGNDPTRGSAPYALSLSDCVERLSLKQSDYLCGLDITPRFDRSSPQDNFTAPRHVVIEVEAPRGVGDVLESWFLSSCDFPVLEAQTLLAR